MKIWQRHLLAHFLRSFFFSLFAIVAIYIAIDLSVQGGKFFFSSYYLYMLSTLLDLFTSLAFLLATLRTLFDLTQTQEFLSLQMGGLSKKKLLVPLFFAAAFLYAILSLNNEYFLPKAYAQILAFKGKKKELPLHTLLLADHSTLVYQTLCDHTLHDLFWICPDEIWHMNTLDLNSQTGHFVHRFTKTPQLQKQEDYAEKNFPHLLLKKEDFAPYVPKEHRSLTLLHAQGEKSHLYYKLLLPLMPLLILFSLAPFCMRFSRLSPLFLTSAASLFLFFSFKIILEGMLILSVGQVLLPVTALCMPIVIFTLLFTPVFLKMR